METKLTTLCYMERGGEYLMLHRTKKENDENRDKWIGVGGKFEPGESPEDCLRREVREETGLTLTRWRYRGLVTFVSDVWPCEYMHLFTADAWTGEQRPCDEGELAWIGKDELLTKKLWAGDRIFLHLLAEDAPFFSLKLVYRGEELTAAELDGKPLALGLNGRSAKCTPYGRGSAPPLQEHPIYPDGRGNAPPKARPRKTCPFRALRISRISPLCKNARRRWKTSAPGVFHVLHLQRLSAQPPAAVLGEPALHGGQLIPLAAPRLPAPVLPLENIFTLRHISCLLLIYNIVN